MKKIVCAIVCALALMGCGRKKEVTVTPVRVIYLGVDDPAPVKAGCWYDYQLQCHGCYYYFSSGDECFLCDGPPIGPGPIYPPYGR